MLIHKLLMLGVLAVAANLDNLGVGIAYGLKRTHITPTANLLIALLAAELTFLAMAFGQWVSQVLSAQVANALGAGLILSVGLWVYFEAFLQPLCLLCGRWFWQCYRSLLAHFLFKAVQVHSDSKRLGSVLSAHRDSRQFSNKQPRATSVQETLVLGVSLALNAVASGFGASLSGYNAVLTALAIGSVSYLTIEIGQSVSKSYFSQTLGNLAQKGAGLMLIVIGLYELFF